MTLVLAYMNPDFVVLAADRRVIRGRVVEDDARTKSLVWNNRFLFGFTGLAELGKDGVETMKWLALELAKQTTLDSEEIKAVLAQAVIGTPGSRTERRLALIGVGYGAGGRATYLLISNMHSDTGRLLPAAREDFWVSVVWPNVRSTIRAVGQSMPSKAGQALLSRLRATHGERLPSEATVHEILVGSIQASANEFISDTALITTLRRTGGCTFDVVTPKAKPGQTVDLASPYLIGGGAVMVMPSQPMRLARRGR